MRAEQAFMKRLERIAAKHMPIYDDLKPDPATGRRDCPTTRAFKTEYRACMIVRMMNNMKKFDAGYV